MAGYQLTDGQMKAIREVVRHYRSQILGEVRSMTRVQTQQDRYVVLDEDLPAATAGSALTSPGQATASVYYIDSSGDLVDSGENIEIYNYFEHVEIVSGTLGVASVTSGRWRLVSADCDALT